MRSRTIFYINVGQLPKAKAEEYVKEMMEKWKEQSTPISGDEVLYFPIRDGESRVEVYHYYED